ncbi:MAG: hypothetical protein ABSG67_22255 [Thermoguttaceae bacterium]|jgi:hypothetical protein
MSAISSSASVISSAAASYVAKVTGSGSTQNTAINSIVQEATETPAQTLEEAASGDEVAIAKLAKEQKANQAQVSVSEPGKGEQVDKTA